MGINLIENNMVFFWLIVLVVLAIVEMSTIQLVAVWFCFGSLGAVGAALLRLSLAWQIVIFLAISVVLMVLTRPFVKKFLMPKLVKTNYDRVIGMEGIVLEDIDNMNNTGTLKVLGQIWTARAEENYLIKAGETVKIIGISGVKLIVKSIKTEEIKEG